MNNFWLFDTGQLAQIGSAVVAVLSGICVWWSTQTFMSLMRHKRESLTGRYEKTRLANIRQASWIFKSMEPLIDELSGVLGQQSNYPETALQRALRRHPEWRDWRATEFLSVKIVEGFLVGIAVFLLVWPMGFISLALFLAVGSVIFYPVIARKSVMSAAERHINHLRSRLPFTVDQIALMMGAGAGFEECLRTVVADDPLHPLSEELAIVLADCETGRTRREAMLDLRTRVPDQDIADFVFAVVKGEELGTPLGNILADQAEQMRLRRAQWGEKAAAEAEVQIVFPGMLVMLACLIVVVAPMVLPAAFNIFND
jgi:Flp pilus assembly protein TadB